MFLAQPASISKTHALIYSEMCNYFAFFSSIFTHQMLYIAKKTILDLAKSVLIVRV